MSAPRLSRRLVLEAPERASDGAGGFIETWVAKGELWAEISARTGNESGGATASLSRVSYRITVRGAPWGAPSRPTANQRFREGDRIFRILAVAERDTDGRYLTCFAEEERVA